MRTENPKRRHDLPALARQAMLDRGFLPDFPEAVQDEVRALQQKDQRELQSREPGLRDLRKRLWCSIDNDDSRDLDQLTVAEPLSGDAVKILVAIADVDFLVDQGSATDRHAQHNTTSVYTAVETFPMLPEPLSTDLTSLADQAVRLAMVIELVVTPDGNVTDSEIYRAVVKNHAKLAYRGVAAWLEKGGPMPAAMQAVAGLDEQIRIQDRIAQKLKSRRHQRGALGLETLEPKAIYEAGVIADLRVEPKNRAKELIEDFMIAANGVTARFLEAKGFPSLRRVLRSPARWERIVGLASEHGETLPEQPDSAALEAFLQRRKQADPTRFADLSLSIVKLMGSGEYVLDRAQDTPPGHFGLAVRDYAHSTAPNRRFPDLITQRLLKAALAGRASPYKEGELEGLAAHCTKKEDDANKVERQMRKSAAASLLEDRAGERYEAIVTGASAKGTWVRLCHPSVEGKVVEGSKGLDVGDRVMVELLRTDVERGFIDFACVDSAAR